MCVIVVVLFVCFLLIVLVVFIYGSWLEGFDYGYLVKIFVLELQWQLLEMVYLDIVLKKVFIGVVVLLYGKNFCVVIWKELIKLLVVVGYWVIVLDQVGFCKFSKFECYQYMFVQLVVNIYVLLQQL